MVDESSMQSTSTEESEDLKKNPSPAKVHQRWHGEMEASHKFFRNFVKQGDATVNRYRDNRRDGSQLADNQRGTNSFRLNIFHSNITTLRSMLFGRAPKVDVSRRYNDADDDVARVAALILNRVLNNDIQEPASNISTVLRQTLDDRLLPGLGLARLRYEMEEKDEEVPPMLDPATGEQLAPGYLKQVLDWESATVEYVHWRDVRWSFGRTFNDLRWLAFRTFINKTDATERFGKEVADSMDFVQMGITGDDRGSEQPTDTDHQQYEHQAEVWEIWCEEDNTVFWYHPNCDKILEQSEDPFGLDGFYPCPPGMLANLTTTEYMPKPDYMMAQDIYNEIDILETRIGIITRAVKVIGFYDKENTAIKRLFTEANENDLIPVENWGMLGEKGGIKGVVEWYPVNDVVQTLDKLRELRDENIQLVYQITGMSDILRGANSPDRTTATSDSLKAKFGSVRVQALQDEFAHFSSSLMGIKAEMISLHYSPETLLKQSNILSTPDAELAEPAIQMIKDTPMLTWRVEIKPESLAMVDYASLKQERTEYLTAVSTFLQSSVGLIQQDPSATPFLLQLMKWGLTGFKGSQEIEGVVDRAITSLENNQKQPKQPEGPSPEEIKIQGRLQEVQAKHQAKMKEIETDAEADIIKIHAQAESDMREGAFTAEADTAERMAEHEMRMVEISAEAETNQQDKMIESNLQKYLKILDAEIDEDATTRKASLDFELQAQAARDKREPDA